MTEFGDRKKPILAWLLSITIVLSIFSALDIVPSSAYTLQDTSAQAGGEPLTASTGLTRSFTHPNLSFMGQNVANLTESITWYQNGSTNISDSMGNSLTLAIPIQPSLSFTLLQNSTMVDQKLTSPSLQYDIYWKPLQNSNGFIDRYKMTIVGSSANGSEIQFPVTSSENMASNATAVLTTKGAASVLSSSSRRQYDAGGSWHKLV